ncbi:hypothetical protein SUGI_1074350 [Cryptomeria japonica]|uniref:uncharacterized protein At1g66480 n=1 Tax=Cryptomeria japonica TaxID=3369 RepID=UPI002414A7EE|nr:uncharacterized protein At1g66480 [Cryptomeria japonica]GLJ50409.1 hypothetical protein SUGI_1074350 [Cryptomeria japonica]
MGNAVTLSVGHRRVKVMKLDGEVLKFKPPVSVEQVLENYPNHVILHSDAVRHMGVRAIPLEESVQLRPKQLYFLVEMPKLTDLRAPTRVRSSINMSAKSRLETMLLKRRSNSDIGALTCSPAVCSSSVNGENGGPVRLQVRLSKAQFEQLESQSKNSCETAEKVLDLYLTDAEAQQINGSTSSVRMYPKAEESRVKIRSNFQSTEVF